ncbi:hypothetical protein BJY00DRAFT_293127 [Aspergillus carlsbadensis]|nr:hypothetical protein BJY00DRAFT_293127 [Aspergillus carlsbadensis]
MGPYDAEVGDPRRIQLINKIASHIPKGEKVEPGFWAFIWLSHITKLEEFVDKFSGLEPYPKRLYYALPTCSQALKTWASRDRGNDISGEETTDPTGASLDCPTISDARSRSRSPSKIPQPSSSRRAGAESPRASKIPPPPKNPPLQPKKFRRSAALIDKCRLRDQDTCRITKGGDCTEVCHIYPFSLATKVGTISHTSFWDLLSFYWSREQIRSWEEKLLGPSRTEILENVICLAQTVHGLWGKGRFALKPISLSTDAKTLTVEFYWLHEYPYEYRLLATPPFSPASVDCTRRGTRLLDCRAKRILESGDLLTFKTEDPDTLPLPSIEILQLQWILNRLVSLSGAADVPDEQLNPDQPLGLAPPISVGYDEETIWEAEQGQEEDTRESLGAPAVPAAPVPQTGENKPLVQSESKGGETAEENPLALRTQGPNIF